MTVVRAKLGAHLRSMTAPFLFVGSGLSRRYIGTEDWEGLLRRFAALTPRPYEFYRTSAEGYLPSVASKIAEVFHDIWWASDDFESSRHEWSSSMDGIESALKVEIAKHLSVTPSLASLGQPEMAEIELLRNAVVDGVITTNYDSLLEELFPDFRTFVGQDELLFANPQGVGEIYKIHGSCRTPDSLVLTAKDYATFERRNAYLAAKLMTIFVEHPVVFLGYSLGDENVMSILRSVAGCLKQENIDELRDRLVFIQWQPEAESSVEPHTIMMDGGFSLTVLRVTVPDFVEVFEVLSGLKRAFPAKMLRRLKEQVYDLVLSDDPHNRLLVADIDDASKDDDIEVVFGVGVSAQLGQTGYVGLGRWNIIDDVISGDSSLDASAVLGQVLPRLLGDLRTYPSLSTFERLKRLMRQAIFSNQRMCMLECVEWLRRVGEVSPPVTRMGKRPLGISRGWSV
ncbi:SIR2 family protein [Streptomyces durmitorensis]|uniref:SIR2 family protein n=1 Tax=Streptomyces durmitorensis TaxID=319947 RepID=A0ABY4PS00_9ACTN|nr:SIR2 family protein [Streptomyces durmitorensis]UQT55994.1 SIR2 family protein [Streptomyces durmitorensis]